VVGALTMCVAVACGGKLVESDDGAGGADAGGATGGSGGAVGGNAGTGGVTSGGTGGSAGASIGGTGGTAGAGGTAGSAGSGPVCEAKTGEAECDACLGEFCLNECIALQDDPNGHAFVQCYNLCADQACYDACDAQFPEAHDHNLALLDCLMDDDCAIPCDAPPQNYCSIATGDAECDKCFWAACETECAEAAFHPDVDDYFDCLKDCTDDDCAAQCGVTHPDAMALLNTLVDCAKEACPTACDNLT